MAEEKTSPKPPVRKSIFDRSRAEKAEEEALALAASALEVPDAPSTPFRLPRFFSHNPEELGNGPLPGIADDIEPVVAERPVVATASPAVVASVPAIAPASLGINNDAPAFDVTALEATALEATALEATALEATGAVADELAAMREEIERLTEQVTEVNGREASLERVFDALHTELAGYKNDFLYEHLKPVVRPLLFLFDSIEQFDSEVTMAEATSASSGVLSAPVVHENVRYFRDQLVEALQVCEVTIMEAPSGPFNAKMHKAVDVMPVGPEHDNTIVRVVRSGWFLNGQLLRPAEVVVGKYRGPAVA